MNRHISQIKEQYHEGEQYHEKGNKRSNKIKLLQSQSSSD